MHIFVGAKNGSHADGNGHGAATYYHRMRLPKFLQSILLSLGLPDDCLMFACKQDWGRPM